MNIRILKTIFVALIAMLCLVYAGQNIANLEMAYQSIAYVMSNVDHDAYGNSFIPTVSHPVLIWAALILIVGLEFLAGFLSAKGAVDMWSARNASPDKFRYAKKFALYGCGVGVVVWLGFFGVVGGAVFQMWQTEIGSGSLAGAFQIFASCAFVFIIVSMADE